MIKSELTPKETEAAHEEDHNLSVQYVVLGGKDIVGTQESKESLC